MTTSAPSSSSSTAATTTTQEQSGALTMRPGARSLLENRSYNIEFHGFLSNHAKHAVIALERLSAPQERVQEYWDEYTKMTPYGLALEKLDVSDWVDAAATIGTLFSNKWIDTKQDKWNTWRGKKIEWPEQVLFLNQELKDRFLQDTNKLVHFYASDLIISGIAGSLTHGIIHLGWAIDCGSPWMIAEGLAYLNFGHLGVNPSLLCWPAQDNIVDATAKEKETTTESESSIMDALIRVANVYESENLKTTWIDRVKAELNDTTNFHPELVCAGFQWELSKILSRPHAVATQMPSSLSLSSLLLSKEEGSIGTDDDGNDDDKLWREMYFATVYLYLATRNPDPNAAAGSKNGHEEEDRHETYHGNFLVLHLITSLWGLEHTVKAIAAGAPAEQNGGDDGDHNINNNNDIHSLTRKALGQFYATMICMLATSGTGFPSASALKDIQQEFPTKTTLNDDDDNDNDKNVMVDWTPTVRKGIAEQEEHNIKLVYVMKELWHRYHQWNGFYHAANAFTLTPNIGPVVVFVDKKEEEEEKQTGFKKLRAS
jgi:Questin oxidase-like